ncbi:MAG: hypothetical protein ACJA2Q_002418 [Pseudohongiellaceae bacterium]|jgi:hypothetical protein
MLPIKKSNSTYGIGFGFVKNRRVKFEPFTAAVSGDKWDREISWGESKNTVLYFYSHPNYPLTPIIQSPEYEGTHM